MTSLFEDLRAAEIAALEKELSEAMVLKGDWKHKVHCISEVTTEVFDELKQLRRLSRAYA